MNTPRLFALLLALASAGLAQSDYTSTNHHRSTVTLDLGEPRAVAMIYPGDFFPPAIVNVGAAVTLRPDVATYGTPTSVTWSKNGVALATTSPTLTLSPSTAADSGLYRATFVHNGATTSTDGVQLQVGVTTPLKLLATSMRTRIGSDNTTAIVGFTISAAYTPQGLREKPVLVRAVGPTLANYGVATPLAAPTLRLYNAAGTDITSRYVSYPGQTSPTDDATTIANQAAAAAGTFPLPPGSKDVSWTAYLPAGAYTAHVSSADGGTGDVLIEIYELP